MIFGADRHHELTAHLAAERRAWPSPFDALIADLKSLKGKRVAVLATGDPLWYSVGARIARDIDRPKSCFTRNSPPSNSPPRGWGGALPIAKH